MSNELVASEQATAFVDLLKRTNEQNPSKADISALRKALNETPELWRMAGDIAKGVTQKTVEKINATETLKASLLVGLDVMKKDLGYQHAPELERLLIEHVVMCWLRLNLEEHMYTGAIMNESVTFKKGDFYERRLSAMQHRYLRACEALARVRKLTRGTPALQVNIATNGGQQINLGG